jgi:hypothetical protein
MHDSRAAQILSFGEKGPKKKKKEKKNQYQLDVEN